MENGLQYLLDRAAVSDVVLRFFEALDSFDTDAVRACLADEFTLDAGPQVTPNPEPQPVAQFIEGLVARNWGFESTAHLNPNHLIDLDGDRATVRANMWASHIVGEGPQDLFVSYGKYTIDLIRKGDSWRMTKLRIGAIRTEGGAAADIYKAAADRLAAGEGH